MCLVLIDSYLSSTLNLHVVKTLPDIVKPEIHHCGHWSPPLNPVMSHFYAVHNFRGYFSTQINIIPSARMTFIMLSFHEVLQPEFVYVFP
jgi:hypothetical protein